MKKLIITLLVSLFFIGNVDALTTINKMDINVKIDENGIATVNEVWSMPKQNSTEIKKIFYNTANSKITDLVLTDSNSHQYINSNNIKNKIYNYKLNSRGKSNYIYINTDGSEKVITLNYKITGMIKSYNDLDGINWYFLNTSNDMDVKSLNVTIEDVYPYTEGNVGLYGIGNNLDCSIKEGKIILTAEYLSNHSKVLLLTTFTDKKYNNTIKINSNYIDYYKKNKPSIINDIRNFLASETVLIIIIVITLIVIFVILRVSLGKKKNIFDSLTIKSKTNLVHSTKDAEYYELLPCDGDFYHLEFLAAFFNITKSRSNIIAATILRWIINGIAEMDSQDKVIILKENLKFTNPLDEKLYEILIESCESNKIKKNTLNKYIENNQEKLDEWYMSIYEYAINKEYNLGNIKKGKKTLIVTDEVVESANKLMGLKKYLLNFNQVPRSSELTPKLYENLLIVACLLGLSNSLSKEILRKNKDNRLALVLEEFTNVRDILLPTYTIKTSKVDFINCVKQRQD